MSTLSSESYRDGMRLLAGAVTIITSAGEHGRGGITATAVVSVTDQPPTLLVCVNASNDFNPIIKKNKVFVVNVLSAAQEALSNRFAGFDHIPMAERLSVGNWVAGLTGAPVLADALVSFECLLSDLQEVGTHTVIFGEVYDIRVNGQAAPLLYFDRHYGTVAPV